MIRKIKTSIVILATMLLSFGMPTVAISGIASAADCSGATNNINAGANAAFGTDTCNVTTTGGAQSLASIAKTAVNVLSLIVGIVAVIMIIYGGLRYITSGGDSGSVGNAKNTLIYAIIGLIIVALAQLIVHFVLNAALTGSTNTGTS
jgi:hypothetical protein